MGPRTSAQARGRRGAVAALSAPRWRRGLAARLRLRARRRRRRQVRWWTQPAAAGGGRTRWSRRASCAARSCWRSGRRAGGRRAQLAWRSGMPADGVIRLSGRPPRRRRRPNGPSTRGGAAAAPGARASGARCAGRPPTRGAPEAAGSGYGRGGRKTKTGGRRWRGLGWRAIAGLWSRCASATGRAGSTASTLLTRRLPRASAGVPLLSLPFLRVRGVAAATKPRLPKVGSPTLGSVVVRRTASAGYPPLVDLPKFKVSGANSEL